MMKDLSVLQEVPFTDHGSIVEVFTDLSVWAGIRQVIERVNANAAAATHLPHLARRISTWNYAVLPLPLFRGGVARRGRLAHGVIPPRRFVLPPRPCGRFHKNIHRSKG